MRTISIYNNYLPDNQDRRELLSDKIKNNGFATGRDGEFMFVIGGDGTFLKAIQRNMRDSPVFIGINTGNLGYLSEFDFNDVDDIFEMIKKKQYWLQNVPIFEAVVTMKDQVKRLYFVNDLVVERKSTRIIHTDVHINEERFCSLSGDGLVVSTSIGSTGYAIAASGSISYDCDDVMQLTPLHPVNTSAYRSFSKTVLLKTSNEVSIHPSFKKKRPFRIVCDGNEIKLRDVRSVAVKRSPFNAKILRSKGYKNTDNIKGKILFND